MLISTGEINKFCDAGGNSTAPQIMVSGIWKTWEILVQTVVGEISPGLEHQISVMCLQYFPRWRVVDIHSLLHTNIALDVSQLKQSTTQPSPTQLLFNLPNKVPLAVIPTGSDLEDFGPLRGLFWKNYTNKVFFFSKKSVFA